MNLKLDVSPAFGQIVGLAVTTLGALGTMSSQLTTLFGEGNAKMIIAGGSIAAFVLGPLAFVLSRGASSQPGPWATQDGPVMAEAAKVEALPPGASAASIETVKVAAMQAVADHKP
jgi:hypothetical protein